MQLSICLFKIGWQIEASASLCKLMQPFTNLYKNVHKPTQASISIYKPMRACTNWAQQGPPSLLSLAPRLLVQQELVRCSHLGYLYLAHSLSSRARTLRDLLQSLTRTLRNRPHPPSAITHTHLPQSLARNLSNRPHPHSVALY